MPVYSWRNTKSENNKTRDFGSGRRWSCILKVQLWQRLYYFKKKNRHHRCFGGDFGQGSEFIAGGIIQRQSTAPPLGFHWKEQELEEGNRKSPIKQPSSTLECPALQEPPHIYLYCVLAHRFPWLLLIYQHRALLYSLPSRASQQCLYY